MTIAYSGDSITFPDNSVQNTAPKVGMVNRIINGSMNIDQRNAGASVTISSTAADTYSLDRWCAYGNVTSKFSVQQNAGSVTPPAGFRNYIGVTSLAATSVGASDQYYVAQYIEGFNTADLMFGSASAATVTLSFWVRSSLTGTFGGAVNNSAVNRSYPFSYTISAANTWEQKTVSITGDTTGTWLTTNGVGLRVHFGLGVGSTISGTAGAWAGSPFISATGATSVVGTSGATFYITGVQLEKGSTATSFDYRPYGTELLLAQRYYVKLTDSSGASNALGLVQIEGTTTANFVMPIAMRAAPSGTSSGLTISDGSVTPTVTSLSNFGNFVNGVGVLLTASGGGLTIGRAGRIRIAGSTTAYLDFSSEL